MVLEGLLVSYSAAFSWRTKAAQLADRELDGPHVTTLATTEPLIIEAYKDFTSPLLKKNFSTCC